MSAGNTLTAFEFIIGRKKRLRPGTIEVCVAKYVWLAPRRKSMFSPGECLLRFVKRLGLGWGVEFLTRYSAQWKRRCQKNFP